MVSSWGAGSRPYGERTRRTGTTGEGGARGREDRRRRGWTEPVAPGAAGAGRGCTCPEHSSRARWPSGEEPVTAASFTSLSQRVHRPITACDPPAAIVAGDAEEHGRSHPGR